MFAEKICVWHNEIRPKLLFEASLGDLFVTRVWKNPMQPFSCSSKYFYYNL